MVCTFQKCCRGDEFGGKKILFRVLGNIACKEKAVVPVCHTADQRTVVEIFAQGVVHAVKGDLRLTKLCGFAAVRVDDLQMLFLYEF